MNRGIHAAAILAAGCIATPAPAAMELDWNFGSNGISSEGIAVTRVLTGTYLTLLGFTAGGSDQPGPRYYYAQGFHRMPADGSPTPFPAFQFSSSFANSPTGSALLQPDGKVVLATLRQTTGELAVMRLQSNGTPDSAFGGVDGEARVPIPLPAYARDIALQSDGKILVLVGARLVRLLATGALDATYGNAGIASLPPTPYSLYFSGFHLALLPDDRAVVIAKGVPPGCPGCSYSTHMFRIGTGGAPDPSFNGSGGLELPGWNGSALAVLADGRVVLGGVGQVLRLTAQGTLDSTFGAGGIVTARNVGSLANVFTDADGAVTAVAVGPVLMRWKADGTPEGRIAFRLPRTAAYATREPSGSLILSFSAGPGDTDSRTSTQLVRVGSGGADLFAEARLFAAQQYRDFLQREGDPGGIAYWAGQLDSGATGRAQLIASFLASPEFGGVVAPVVRLYLAYFNRFPDQEGFEYWTNAFRGGASLTQISDSFALSQEFTATYGSLGNAAFVGRVYNNVLGRDPDPGGLQYWTGRLDSGAMTRGELMVAFSEAAEFRALSANEVLVISTYSGMLRRVPDPGGFAFWVGRLDQGASAAEVTELFVTSSEYRGRFLP